MKTTSLKIVEDNLFITHDGITEPAWKHEDGTIVSHWDGLEKLTIQDSDGVCQIEHSDAKEFGYEN